ncbi:hypothetical protein [Streptomyces sp. NPDC127066]|uniref:hypothetical protein n=1 Tax=Streptomyces sp. NPDC127066 TaxID=3347125 RepID=UPI003652B577
MALEQHAKGVIPVLWHARHLAVEEDGRIVHRDPDGTLRLDEEKWRIIGLCTTEVSAEAQREASKDLPGFRDEPDCFEISSPTLDEDLWTEGFFTEFPDGMQRD